MSIEVQEGDIVEYVKGGTAYMEENVGAIGIVTVCSYPFSSVGWISQPRHAYNDKHQWLTQNLRVLIKAKDVAK